MINCPVCGRPHDGIQCAWCAADHVQRQMLALQRAQMRPQYYNSQQPPEGPRDLAAATVALLIAAACIAGIVASWTVFWWLAGVIIVNYLIM